MKRGPKTLVPPRDPGPWPCFLKCGRVLHDKYTMSAYKGWEWMTGYGESPVHFCPECRSTRQADIALIRERLNTRPANYPTERVKP